jgi:hypothetical protein
MMNRMSMASGRQRLLRVTSVTDTDDHRLTTRLGEQQTRTGDKDEYGCYYSAQALYVTVLTKDAEEVETVLEEEQDSSSDIVEEPMLLSVSESVSWQ